LLIVGAVKSPILFLGSLLAAIVSVTAATGGTVTTTPDKFFVPLFSGGSARLEGVLASREFAFRLPEHVRYLPGSQCKLVFRASPLLLPDVSTMTVSLNGRQLTSLRPVAGREKQLEKQTVAIDLDNDILQPGWNKLLVRCLLVTTSTPCRDVDNPASWVELAGGTGFEVAFAEQALFPELQRFPDALGEPQLMRMGAKNSEPAVSLLVANQGGDTAWRGVVVAAARLGQLLYLDDKAVRIGSLKDFAAQSGRSNGVIVAKREDLAAADLPVEFGLPLRGLKNGEGFLGEFITGEPARGQRRWIVVSGADDAGLEKAILALGSAPALRDAAANPWIIKEAPVVSPVAEKLAGPAEGPVTFDSLTGGGIMLRGLFRNETARSWPLPPGWQTGAGGELAIDFSHAENLDKTSAFEVVVNNESIGSIALTEANAQRTRRVLPVPAGLPGRDPSTVAIRSYLDIGTVDCAHRNEERAWLDLAGSSTIDVPAVPLVIDDLSCLGLVALRDAFLRRAVLIVPDEASEERNDMMVRYALHLGRQLSSMPVLWPQLATYGPGRPALADRVAGRSGIVLGSSRQWGSAFPRGTPLAAGAWDQDGSKLDLRGQTVPMAEFERGLVMAQLMPSPWRKGELFAVVGGLTGYGGDDALAMLTDPDLGAQLAGNISAVDPEGRVVNYDTRLAGRESLAGVLRQTLDGRLSAAEIRARKEERQNNLEGASEFNRVMVAGVGGVLAAVFLTERLLSRRRHINRKKNNGQ
jgi:hypothetical protein